MPNSINLSVTLMSSGCLLPGAETITNFRFGFFVMIDPTFWNWVAFATELPPNFATLIINASRNSYFYCNLFLFWPLSKLFFLSRWTINPPIKRSPARKKINPTTN